MTRVHILVEGQTEETIVRDIVGPYLLGRGIFVSHSILKTKRPAGGASFKGGVVRWSKIERDIRLLLGNSSFDRVTTLFDYYGFPSDAPGMSDRPSGGPYGRVTHVEEQVMKAIGDRRFLPNLILHETEAWVLAGCDLLGEIAEDPRVGRTLREVVERAGGPELVNDGPATAPSKRIVDAYPSYMKVLDGPLVVATLGMNTLRQRCSRVDRWLRCLETGNDLVANGHRENGWAG